LQRILGRVVMRLAQFQQSLIPRVIPRQSAQVFNAA
jgi:hypothetical protein